MLPELLRFSSRSRLLDSISDDLKNVHHTDTVGVREDAFSKPHAAVGMSHPIGDMLNGWRNENLSSFHGQVNANEDHNDFNDDIFGDDQLASLGL